MHSNKLIPLICLVPLLLVQVACKKYLDVKPSKALVVPETVAELQALLDNNEKMNANRPMLGQASSDEYYLLMPDWQSLDNRSRAAYLWDSAVFESGLPNDWSYAFEPVYYANVVLDGLARLGAGAGPGRDNLLGAALFYRSMAFLQAAGIWAGAYDPADAKTKWGIPIRLSPDFNEPSHRATLLETYDRIVSDLKIAAPLLPLTSAHPIRPSRSAAYALLARAYLWMGNWDSCARYADSSWKLNNGLINYNTLNPGQEYPFSQFNAEVLFHSTNAFTYVSVYNAYARVDSALVQLYDENDLRKSLFFKQHADSSFYFTGSYDGSYYLFNGITTAEVLLMRAEALARLGRIEESMSMLNTLLQNRRRPGTFIPLVAGSQQEAIELILAERRMELVFRDLRWMDIKRCNKAGSNIWPQRVLDNRHIMLAPNDNRYALPIPADIISLTGMPQNPR